jgi:hypothetical protein
MSEGLVCLLIKSANPTPNAPVAQKPILQNPKPAPAPAPKLAPAPAPAQAQPLVYGKTSDAFRRQIEPLQKVNPRAYQAFSQGTFTPIQGRENVYTYRPSEQELGLIGRDEKYQQALYDANKSGDFRNLYDYYAQQTPGQAVDYGTAQTLNMRKHQLQQMLPKNMDVSDPQTQKQLEGYKTLPQEAEALPGQVLGAHMSNKGMIRGGLEAMTTSSGTAVPMEGTEGLNRKIYDAQRVLSDLKETGASPEDIAPVQATVDKLVGLRNQQLRVAPKSTLGNYVKDLATRGAEAEKAQAALNAGPAAAQAYASQALQDPQTKLDLEQFNKQQTKLPVEASPDIAGAIPWQNKLTMWAKDNPGLSAGILAAGGGLLALMLGRLFSGGQQQAPQVVYQQAPMPPQQAPQPKSRGSAYNIFNLMG